MFSKLIKPIFGLSQPVSQLRCGLSRVLLSPPRVFLPARTMWGIPPSQYDMAIPKKLHFGYACKEYWELIPVMAVTLFDFLLVVLAFIFASRNKVDVVFTTHSRNNISRTMDLRHPTIHKVITINQRMEPWPEMQDVLDQMRKQEKTLKDCAEVDIVFSTHSRDNISRTMDLRNPSVHKIVTINQKYEPWPEMQIVFDKMLFAEKRLRSRSLSCTNP